MSDDMNLKIDFVVTWLNSDDPAWQKEYMKYKSEYTKTAYTSMARYRNWDLFRYWFRSVEKYAPWVNKVFLVTNGQFPDWINEDHPKLVLIKHSDYIPAEYLPTFNSHTIELNMNKIPGLSEHFVYFNDDSYLNAPVTPDYYFREGLPCDCNEESIFLLSGVYTKENGFFISIIRFCCISVLNGHFKRKEVIKGNFWRWHGIHLHFVNWLMSFILSLHPRSKFINFKDRHYEQPFLKSVLDEAWEKESEMLTKSCSRFREDINLSPYFFRYWQFATNRFYPIKLKHALKFVLLPEYIPKIIAALKNKNVWSLCANDTTRISEDNFEKYKCIIQQAFEDKFPNKSQYEKY